MSLPDAHADPSASVRVVERLLKMLEATSVTELEVQFDGLHVEIRRAPIQASAVGAEDTAFPTVDAPTIPPDDGRATVKSAYVGSFHRPTDGTMPALGAVVTAGSRIAEIEVLGIRNPVVTPIDGILEEILVEDEAAVEYGQLLVVIHPRSEQ